MRRKWVIGLFSVTAVWGISASDALAQGPPINTDTPIMLGVQGRGIRTFGKIIRKATLLQDGSEIADPTDRQVTVFVTPLAVPYNLFNDKFQLGIIVPFMNVDVNKNSGDFSSSGIGDLRLFAKYLVYQYDRKNKTIRVASKAGVKLPSGDENDQPPLGTGSTDYFFTTVAGWIEGRVGVYLEGIYNLNTSRAAVDFGNSVSYNLAFGYRLLPVVYETYPSPQLNGFLEINGTTTNKNTVNDQKVNDSGGTTIFLSPGLQYVGGRRWLIEASVQIPIVNEPNGTQLATDWTVSLGTRILMF
ncbi:MAG: transporter [bacterium]